MKKIFLTIALLAFSISCSPVLAQSPDPVLVNGTKPISTETRDAINVWLAETPPSVAPYYAVTYTKNKNGYVIISLVGLNISSPDDDWSFENGEQIIWVGTIKVYDDGSVEIKSGSIGSRPMKVHAAPRLPAAGGGAYVAFPWEAGKGVLYGPRGVHGEGGYGTSGMYAVDLVSGLDMGSGAANNYAYASDDGTIDYVCDDGTTVAVRTYNETTGDYFLYAHLLDNANLEIDIELSRGQSIGALKQGTFKYPSEDFPGNCGWAQQADNHWHVHWMFVPSGGFFRAEDCILSISAQTWNCGTVTVGTGQFLVGGGGTGSSNGGSGHTNPGGSTGYTGTGSTNASEGSLWDYLIVGIAFIIDPFFQLVPEHNGLQFVYTIYYSAELVIRLVRVFAWGNINLGPTLTIFFAAIVFNTAMGALWVISFVLKAWKSLVPILGA